jgi:hypothetical protein
MAADTRVSSNSDATLTIALPPLGAKTFRAVEVKPLLFRSEDGFYFAFGEDEYGKVNRLDMSGSIVDPVSFNRLRWYESGTLHASLAAIGYFVFLSFCVIAFAGFVIGFLRKTPRDESSRSRIPRLAWRTAALVSTLVVLSPILALAWYHLGDPELRPYKLESTLYLSLSVLQLAAFLGIALPYFAFRIWKGGYWSAKRRVYYSIVALAGVLMIPFFY